MRHIEKLKAIVIWICQDIDQRKLDTADSYSKLKDWLKRRGTTVRDVELKQSTMDKSKLIWDYRTLVVVREDFDIYSHVNLQCLSNR